MKSILIDVPYGKCLLLPGEVLQFIPNAVIVETGYDLQSGPTLRLASDLITCKFVDPATVLPLPAPTPLLQPIAEEAQPQTDAEMKADIEENGPAMAPAYVYDPNDSPF